MTDVSGPWTMPELRSQLDSLTVPLRLACRTTNGRLWQVPLWYVYRDGAFLCATGRDADLIEFLRASPGVAFDVSTNELPYRGVRGNGTVSIEPDRDKALLRELLERYLGGTDSGLAESLLRPDRPEVRIEIEPARLVTWDYSDRMPDE
jgi:nitroimidazol reductase NimA-like FMN-containing flavoprotein (pyridoxamine 5'-phosphate oxidase superfamily)